MTKPILRDAETKDMGNIITMMERLIAHEMKISDIPVIEEQERHAVVMQKIAEALTFPDQHVWVVEKSGRILGVFIVSKQEIPLSIQSRNPVCLFAHAYSQKTVLSFFEIHNRVKEWAREQGCKAIVMTALVGNERVQKLTESLGYAKTTVVYEMAI